MPCATGSPLRASAPMSLSSALWRPTSSRTATRPRAGTQKPGCVNGVGFPIQALPGRQRGHGLDNRLGIEAARVGDDRRWPRRFREAFDATEATARRPRHAAAAGGIGLRTVFWQPDTQLDAKRGRDNFEADDLRWRLDQTLR